MKDEKKFTQIQVQAFEDDARVAGQWQSLEWVLELLAGKNVGNFGYPATHEKLDKVRALVAKLRG